MAATRVNKVFHVAGRLHVQGFQGIMDHLIHFTEGEDDAKEDEEDEGGVRLFSSHNPPEAEFSMTNRHQTRLVVVIVSDELADAADAEIASAPELADAADFVVVVGTSPLP